VAKRVRPPQRRGGARKDRGGASVADAAESAAPDGKPWSGRFDEATDRLVEAYTSSVHTDAMFVAEDIEASIAHVRMLARQGVITADEAKKIERGLSEIFEEYQRGEFALLAELEDVHMNVETRLAEKIGPVAGKLHTARSRNDQVATDFRLYVIESTRRAAVHLVALQSSIIDLAEQNADAIMPGYTHLQRAQPVLFAHHMLAYVQMFDRDLHRFLNAMAMMDELPLGSGALAGVPYPIDRQSVADELGFPRVTANSIDAVSDRDFVVDYLSAAALTMVHISRLAEELVLWSSAEFGFITLPDAFATGSSIMPQKKNPDVAELARGRTGRAIGALVSMLVTLKGLPLSYNRDMQEDKPALLDAEATLLPTLEIIAAMLPRITLNAERTAAAATENYSLATDFADHLVRKGLPFRQAHEAVGKLVRYAEGKRVELSALSLAELRKFSPLFAEDALSIDAIASVSARDVPGGTAPSRVRAALQSARVRVDTMMAEAEADAAQAAAE
jgi:argininosuccinate lyase